MRDTERDSGTCRKQQRAAGTLLGIVRWKVPEEMPCSAREQHPTGKTEPQTQDSAVCRLPTQDCIHPAELKKENLSTYKLGFYTTVLIPDLS